MKFLIPQGGEADPRFAGTLTTYKHKGIPLAIRNGHPWAGDNCAFKGFEPGKFTAWLDTMLPYRSTCLFITVPDIVGDAQATLTLFKQWQPQLDGWPLAFVAQDGQEGLELPNAEDFTDFCYDNLADDDDEAWELCKADWHRNRLPWDVLFIGGSTTWKLSQSAVDVIAEAQTMGKRIHIGRVNWGERYRHFAILPGAEKFTCDGTRTRYEGRTKTLAAWSGYQDQQPLPLKGI